MPRALLLVAALVALAACRGALGDCDKDCCPCMCCDKAVNGQCVHWGAKPQCLEHGQHCADACFHLKGILNMNCRDPGFQYPIDNCEDGCKRTINSSLLAGSAFAPSAAQERERRETVAKAVATAGVADAAGRDPAPGRAPAEAEASCATYCCSCSCCTKAIQYGTAMPHCTEYQNENICTTEKNGCSRACGSWEGADGQLCHVPWPPAIWPVSGCDQC